MTFRPRSLLAVLGACLVPTLAHAEGAPKVAKKERVRPVRSGAVLALSLDGGFGSASGYPNDSKLINDKSSYGRTGILQGGGFTLAVGGALAEYLNVGFFLSASSFSKKDSWKVASGGGGMRIDAFPFTWTKNKWLNSWAFYGLAGLGAVNVKYDKPGTNVADLDGTQSFLGLGSFYEIRIGAFGLGPEIRFDGVVTRTASRIALMQGLRLSFYPSRLF
jgi:hypothetical protein